jgi:hypothetical protein
VDSTRASWHPVPALLDERKIVDRSSDDALPLGIIWDGYDTELASETTCRRLILRFIGFPR